MAILGLKNATVMDLCAAFPSSPSSLLQIRRPRNDGSGSACSKPTISLYMCEDISFQKSTPAMDRLLCGLRSSNSDIKLWDLLYMTPLLRFSSQHFDFWTSGSMGCTPALSSSSLSSSKLHTVRIMFLLLFPKDIDHWSMCVSRICSLQNDKVPSERLL
jgi:hypothetical protein